MAKMLEEAGVDALHCTQGMFASKQAIIAPGFVPVMHYAENAAAIKRSVKIPVLAVGRYNDIYMSEAMLRDEKADFIVMARASLADPELPNKAKAGKTEEIIHCIGCNQGCTGETASTASPTPTPAARRSTTCPSWPSPRRSLSPAPVSPVWLRHTALPSAATR